MTLLSKLFKEENADDLSLLNVQFIKQQIEIYEKKFISQSSSSTDQVENTLDGVFKLPEQYSRKTNRIYKQKNYGIMTHSTVIETHKKAAEELQKIDEQKAQKRKERELQKEIRQNILKIKKEKTETGQKANKRGRPKKATS